MISIHALHEESDTHDRLKAWDGTSISIHALHEESDPPFQYGWHEENISIHALHEESDALVAKVFESA